MHRHRRIAGGMALAVTLALSGVADAQGLFGGLIDQAKREAEARAREAVSRAARQRPRTPTPAPTGSTPNAAPIAAVSGDTPFSARATEEDARRVTPGYERYPAFRSFWPAPEPYVPPGQRAQAPTPIPAGTPDDVANGSRIGPQTAQGKAAWTYSPYELKTLSWGDALSPHGSAGLPLYAARNINNSPARQKWITTFDGWLRATYQPKGLVPIPFREIYPEKANSAYIPVQYGISERLYPPWIRKGRFVQPPVPPSSWIGITANALPTAIPAAMVDIPDRTYTFTMVYDGDVRITVPNEAAKLEAEAEWVRRRIGIDAPVMLTADTVVVLLTRDGKLPVRQLTIGETLDRAEAGMRRAGSFSDSADQAALAGLAAMRARHAHELNAPAWVTHERFSVQDFYNDDNVYGRGDKDATYPVYAFDEATYAAARTDAPQWLAITFPRYHPASGWAEMQVFDQMVHHFNFAYARDAIFHPERVAGRPYTPR